MVATLWPAVRDLNDESVFAHFAGIYFAALPKVDPKASSFVRPLDTTQTAHVAQWAAAILTGTTSVDRVPFKCIFAATSTDPTALGDLLRKYGDRNVLDGLEKNPLLLSDQRVMAALFDADEDLYSRPYKLILIHRIWYRSEDRQGWQKKAAAKFRKMADATKMEMPLHGQLLQMAADYEQLSFEQMEAGNHARLGPLATATPESAIGTP